MSSEFFFLDATPMRVNARRFIRKMRGGAQAHLLEADDGHFYVVKFQNNPQHRRILVNEWLCASFLKYLEISAPMTALVRIDEEFLSANPAVYIQIGHTRQEIVPGWHFGSRFPGDPTKIAVYDFVPDTLLHNITNVQDFLGVLAFDKWIGNVDVRQSVFIRACLGQYARAHSETALQVGLTALMIDHGYAFNGPHWEYIDSPLTGLYFRPSVYKRIRGWDDFQPCLDRILYFPEKIIDEARHQIPSAWLDGDADVLERLLERLISRRSVVPELIRRCLLDPMNPLPNWK